MKQGRLWLSVSLGACVRLIKYNHNYIPIVVVYTYGFDNYILKPYRGTYDKHANSTLSSEKEGEESERGGGGDRETKNQGKKRKQY